MSLTRRLRKRLLKKQSSAKKVRQVHFETLEPRILLSNDPLSYSAAAGTAVDLTLRLEQINGTDMLQLIDTGSQSVLQSQALEDTGGVEIIGSDQEDTFRIDLDFDDLLDTLLLTFDGGDGGDALWGPDTDNTWRLTAANEGTLNSRLSFTGIENLTGGLQQDTFDFDDGAGVDGMINGGLGVNTLDYSAYTTGVTIDLGTGAATGTGTAAFIHDFIGGTGEDTLVGSSAPNTWTITDTGEGTINDEITFSGFENLRGTSNNEDAFVLGAEGSITGTIEGGEGGYDSLVIQTDGGETVVVVTDNTGAGTANYGSRTITYSGLEPFIDVTVPENAVINATVLDDHLVLEDEDPDPVMTGKLRVRSASYDFLLSDGSSSDSLSFDNPATSLTVNLKSGDDLLTLGDFDPAFGASLSIAGDSGDDTLVGPEAINAWEITGQDEGTLNIQISFAGVQNLIGGGAADTFALLAGASLSGAITGGGGSDELVGPDADSIWEVTGADVGELKDMASGERLANFIEIGNLTGGSDNEDAFVLGADGSITGTIGGGEGGYDSLVIQSDGGETVVIVPDNTGAGAASYDGKTSNYAGLEPFVDVSDPDNVVIRGTVLDDKIILEDEDADPAITGSMQVRSADPSYKFLIGGSPEDTIPFTNPMTSLTVHLKSGHNTLTLGQFDPGFNASLYIQDFGPSEVQVAQPIVLPGRDVAISAEAINIAPEVAISTRQVSGSDHANAPSTGDSGNIALSGQSIIIGSGAQLLAHVEDGSAYTAGDIQLIASNTAVTPLIQIGESSRDATITIGPSAVLKGGDIRLSAEAGDEAPEETDSKALAIFENFTIEALKTILTDNYSLPVAAMIKRTDALVQVGKYAQIIGSGDVNIEAGATADGTVKAISGGFNPFTLIPVVNFSVAYSEAEATAKALIDQGAILAAGGNVIIDSNAKATASATARTSQNLGTGFTCRNSIAISVAVADSETTAHTIVSQGAVITAGENVSIHAKGTSENTASAETGTYDSGLAGIAVGLGFSDTDIQALVNGTVIATGLENDLDLVPGIGVIAELESKEVASAVSGLRGDPLVKDALLKGEIGPFLPAIMKGSMDSLRENSPEIDWDWPLSIAGTVAYSNADNDVIAKVDSGGVLKSQKDISIQARLTDKVQTVAESVINQPDDKDNTISMAVIVGLYENRATASIESGASLDAGRAISVRSSICYPFLTEPKELYGPEDFASPTAIGTLLDQKLGIQSKLFNSWARSVGVGGDTFGIAGSVDYLDFTNHSEASIRSGANINQDQNYWSDLQSVSVTATTEMELVNLAGIFDINLQASTLEELKKKKDPLESLNPMGSGSEKGGFGGSALVMLFDNQAIAEIQGGARVHTGAIDGLSVTAETDILSIALAQSGSKAGTFGISGTFSYTDLENLTLAQIGSGAMITGGPVTIFAHDDTMHFNLVGGVMKGNNLGIGASVGINEINRTTAAGIGNLLGGPSETSTVDVNISGDLTVIAKAEGDIKVFSLASAIMTEKKIEKKKEEGEGDQTEGPPNTLVPGDPLDGFSLPEMFGDAKGTPTDEDDPANPGEKKKSEGQGKTGVGIAGDVSINTATDAALAYINDRGTIKAAAVGLTSTNETDLIAAAGSAAITAVGEKLSLGIAGSFSKNELDGTTKAFVSGAAIEMGGLALSATRTGDLFALTAGGALAPEKKGIAIAGSVSLNRIENETETYLDQVHATVKAGASLPGDISLSSLDTSGMLVIAGSLSYGGKVGIGASVAYNKIDNSTRAMIKGSILEHDGTLTLTAVNDNEITSAAAGIAASKNTLGASGTVALNFIENEVEASISNSSNRVNPLATNGSILLLAKDDSLIESLSGAVAGAKKGGFGGGLAYNSIENTIEAFVDSSQLATLGSLSVLAQSNEKIKTIAAGGAGAEKLALAGGVALNFIESTIDAHVSNSPDITVSGSISVLATDISTIRSLAGSVAGAGKTALGASVGYNDIENDIKAYIAQSNVTSSLGDISVTAGESATVTSIAAGGYGAGKWAVGGSVSINEMANTTKAYITGGSVVSFGTVLVSAFDKVNMDIISGSAAGAGKAAIGVANSTVITDNVVEAYVGTGTLVKALKGLSVTATSAEDILTIAAAGAGAGKAGIAGSATVTVLEEKTWAHIDGSARINEDNTGADPGQSVTVFASDTTDILAVAGAIAGGGKAGVGAGADVGVITKDTQAFIGPAAIVQANNDVTVLAVSTEDILSISASASGGGWGAIAGSASVYTMDNTTRAFIAGGATITDGATVSAGDSVLVSAFNDTEIDLIAGNISGAGTLAIGASAGVTVIDKLTESFIGQNTRVTAEGSGDGVTANTGQFNVGTDTDSGSEDFLDVSPAAFDRSAVNDDENTIQLNSGHGFTTGQAVVYWSGEGESIGGLVDGETYYAIVDGNKVGLAETRENAQLGLAINLDPSVGSDTGHTLEPDAADAARKMTADVTAPGRQDGDFTEDGKNDVEDPSLTAQRTATAATTSVWGVAVTAVNIDDIETIAVSGSGAGTVAVNVSGAVNVLDTKTYAYIDDGAQVETDRSVLVAAGNDFYEMAIAAAASFAGTVGATPGANVTVVENTTLAFVDDGAVIDAGGDIQILARASEDILAITAGAAVSGTFALAGAVSYVSIDNRTYAFIGDNDGADQSGATIHAAGNILVSAADDTETFLIGGGLGVGFGLGGVGAGVGLTMIEKDTQAFVGPYSSIHAEGKNSTLTVFSDLNSLGALVTDTTFKGLAVQASSSEDVFTVAAAAAGGTYFGLAGGVAVEVIDSDTKAFIGGYAEITSEENVNVSAVNDVDVFSIGGGAGFGAAGIGGGVDVGTLRNDTSAYIGNGAEVSAGKNIDVNALAIKEVDTIAVSAAVGVVGIAGSVSVWTIGTKADGNYSVDDESEDSLHRDAEFKDTADTADTRTDEFNSLLGGYAEPDPNAPESGVPENTELIKTHTAEANADIDASETQTRGKAYSAVSAQEPEVTGTVAYVGNGAVVTAGDDVSLRAKEDIDFYVVTGSISGGVVGIGGSVAIANIQSSTAAYIGAAATVSAGPDLSDDILVHARLHDAVEGLAFAGQAGLVSIGAQVVVFDDASTQTAFIADGAMIPQAGGTLQILAEADRNVKANASGGQIGAVTAGASVAVVDMGGATVASLGGAKVGQESGKTVGNIRVTAASTAVGNADTLAVSGGILVGASASVAMTDVQPLIQASIGDGADIKVARGIAVESRSLGDANADAFGITVAGGASIGVSIAEAHLTPTVLTFL
ncbi:MAG: LEPR-XLL domain-containing protein, partial [Desulfobacterales bacterium]